MSEAKRDWMNGKPECGCHFDVPLKSEPGDINSFGSLGAFDLDAIWPEGCDCVIVMVNKGYGFVPISHMMRHQAYPQNVAKLIEGREADEVWLAPVKRADYIQVAHRESFPEMQARVGAHMAYLQQQLDGSVITASEAQQNTGSKT